MPLRLLVTMRNFPSFIIYAVILSLVNTNDGRFLLVDAAQSQHEQLRSANFQPIGERQCIWYGSCDKQDDLVRYCPYDGPPKPLNDTTAAGKLRALCPDLMKDIEPNNELCCDTSQVNAFESGMTLAQQFLQRCPSCIRNFMQLWCQSTCSPYQASFMDVTQNETGAGGRTYVSEVNYRLTPFFSAALFQSCRDVISPSTNEPALSLMCGMPVDKCSPELFLKFLGKNPVSPFVVNFITTNQSLQEEQKTYHPMNATTIPCSMPTPEGDGACSCQDCRSSCPAALPYPDISEGKCYVGSMECMVFVSLLAFVGLCFVIVLMSVLHYVISSSTPEADYVGGPGPHKPGQGHFKASGTSLINDSEVTICEEAGAWLEARLESICYQWGRMSTRHPIIVFLFGLSVSVVSSCGIYYLQITTDPVALWSSPTSEGRTQKDYFDKNFGPFYRTAQVIIVPKNQSTFKPPGTYLDSRMNELVLGPAYRKDVLLQVLDLQLSLEKLVGRHNGRNVTLKSICTKPLAPDNDECLIQSPLGWFQNNKQRLNHVEADDFDEIKFDYVTHLFACIESPTLPNDTLSQKLPMSCLAPYGGPVFPFVVIGNYVKGNFSTGTAIVLTFLINNNVDISKNGPAEAWEAEFITFMKNYSNPNFIVSFMAQRSVEDELSRESKSDVATILISYTVMFVYIAFSLGQYNIYQNELCYFLVQSKIVLGLVGVVVVLLSVTSSVGLFALAGIPATLIIIEVVPFLVLAVGVDNIFILVQAYQRDRSRKSESMESRIGRLSGEVIPTMFLSSLSECCCFLLGALSTMPAVRTFSLYAGMAIFFDFFLQVTCFLALFTIDVRRQEAGRLEVLCCVRLAPKPTTSHQSGDEGFLYALVRDHYTPFLMWKPVKFLVLLTFILWVCSSIAVMNKIEVGLDQALSMPEDSYVLKYFYYMSQYLSVGAPVYFVVKGNFDYSKFEKQNLICGGSGCNVDSLNGQIFTASAWSNRSFIAQPVSSWLDDYFDWLRPVGNPPCCRIYTQDNETFCPSTVVNNSCVSCNVKYFSGRPDPNQFYKYLPIFLKDNPGFKCAKGGHAAYGQAVKLQKDSMVSGSHFMTYHTVLKTSQDYTNALKNARSISANLTKTINQNGVEVFAYSVFYVYYEQYLTIVHDAIVQLLFSLVAIFFVTTVLLGIDPWSGLMIVSTIILILLNLMGLMYWWHISLNAVSLVNLVMSVGISVEFCAHLVRSFKINEQPTRNERAREALSTMGSSVLSGITLTKFGGIIVLAFSHSQIFQVFYFRMYMGIVLIGATHGLIFLPVLLSFAGPSLNRQKFLNSRQRLGLPSTGAVHQRPPVQSGAMFDAEATTPTTPTTRTPLANN